MSSDQTTDDRLAEFLQLSLHLWNKILLNTSSALTGGLTLVKEYHIDILDIFFAASVLLSIGTIIFVTVFGNVINSVYKTVSNTLSSQKCHEERGRGGSVSPDGDVNLDGPLSQNIDQETSKWVNSTLHWLFKQNQTQFLCKWMASLSEHAAHDHGGSIHLKFDHLNPDKLSPNLKNIKVHKHPSSATLTISCDVEINLLTFDAFATQQTNSQVKLSNFEVNVEHLKGKLLCKSEKNNKVTVISASFDEQPNLSVATKPATTNLTSDEGVDKVLVEELVRSAIRLANVELTLSSDEFAGQTNVSNFTSNASFHPPNKDNSSVDETLISAENVTTPQTYFRNPTPPSKPKVSKEQRLLVKIIKANGLALRDPSGCCDPYCYVELDNPLQQHKTNAIRNTSNPFWDEHFLFDLTARSKEIRLVILDRDKSPNDEFMGLALVPVETLRKNPSTRQILPLEGRQGRDDHVNGSITVEFLFMELAEESSKGQNSQVAARPPYLAVNPTKVVETSRVVTPGGTVITTVTTTAERMSRSTARNNGIVNDAPRMVSRLPHSNDVSSAMADTNSDLITNYNANDSISDIAIRHIKAARQNNKSIASTLGRRSTPTKQTILIIEAVAQEKDDVDAPDIHIQDPEEPANSKPNRSRSLSPGKKQRKRDPSPSKAIKKFFSMKREKQDIRTPETPPIMVRLQTKDNSLSVPSGSHLSPDSAKSGDTTSLRSSGSNSSMLTYEHSTLVMEYTEVDENDHINYSYSLIPKNLAKSGKYNIKGTKLHIYNDHIFVATHFDSTEQCEVCQRNISRRMGVGKQGYKCRDCEYICHKQCHYKTDVVCPSSTVNKLEMEYVGGENVEEPL